MNNIHTIVLAISPAKTLYKEFTDAEIPPWLGIESTNQLQRLAQVSQSHSVQRQVLTTEIQARLIFKDIEALTLELVTQKLVCSSYIYIVTTNR